MPEDSPTEGRTYLSPVFGWRAAITDSGLPPTVRHVALTLSLYMSDKGTNAHPGPARLADDTGRDPSTIKRALKHLVETGWLTLIKQGGLKGERREANVYAASYPQDFPIPSVSRTGCKVNGVQNGVAPGAPVTHQSVTTTYKKNAASGWRDTDDPQAAAAAIRERNAARAKGDACHDCGGSGWLEAGGTAKPCRQCRTVSA